ncbi:hypothetical protein NOF04DRAFT_18196 [Fusarium oxysporum II5]|uniref:BZIP domain-containing protein n=3 Tax=Fusarium oxysporum species complex TaxID=171631 RepID=N1SA68_FUSC4|nr:uncharacterized protein FOIG_15687 [Fusarium odoratissimum NRRL 54006]EMT73977.1 hypothetical protein FOC4_g10001931 [Fusarium odoratissimum]EXL91112.1 hypothetical protein FOIG_15687 [Fusarium odoratissimum NRRL 54006]KAK2127631.1 hypothetical protein NOF04DRAFT_18196 [Fusarium oxysporum II5]TXB99292.1 hypothetical protein FocTR4_00013545 [Fusarium oxysporum f. sp. cubense]
MCDETQRTRAESRRLKKREVDRKAQRSARERTKRRIAQLESMVENLRQNDTPAQITSLIDQLGHVTKERDKLLGVLDSLGSTIRCHLVDLTTSEPAPDTRSESSMQASTRGFAPPVLGEEILPIPTTTTGVSSETTGSPMLQIPMDTPPNDPFTYEGWTYDGWTYNDWTYTVSNKPYPTTMAFDNSILPPSLDHLVQR